MDFTKYGLYILPLLALTVTNPTVTSGSNILLISHIISPSHFYVFEPIIEGLCSRNHNITIQSYVSLKKTPHNVKQLLLKHPMVEKSSKRRVVIHDMTKSSPFRFKESILSFAKVICERLLSDESTKTLLKTGRSFDIVLVDALLPECALVLASLLGEKVILMYSSGFYAWLPTSAPEPPSYIPNDWEFLPSKMTFWQRVYNVLSLLGLRYVHQFHLIPQQEELLHKYLPHAPGIQEAMERVVFHITNADPVMQSPRPTMPNVAHCGSLHCKESKPLPKDLDDFVNTSGEEGFVMFGLGSNVRAEDINTDFPQAVLSVFRQLKQKVVWKFEKELENVPPNVKTVNWMPQQDLLGHTKARLFITHGGLLSLQEAIYHGVPVIAIPMLAEQPGNAARVKELGLGEYIGLQNITTDGLLGLILKVLNDKSYALNVKKYSAILKDQPDPVKKAIFWIEYAIRHDRGQHFRSAGDHLNFLQYFLVDVTACLLIFLVASVGLVIFVAKLCLNKFFDLKNSAKNMKKKTK